MTRRSGKTALGFILTIAGASLGFMALWRGGITWPVFLLSALLLAYGGHIVSHSQMRELVEDAARLIRAWKGGGP